LSATVAGAKNSPFSAAQPGPNIEKLRKELQDKNAMLREKQRPVAAVSADKGAILKLEADAKVQYRPAFIDNKQIMAKQILADRKAVNNIVKSFSPPDKLIVHKKESNELNNGLFDVKKF